VRRLPSNVLLKEGRGRLKTNYACANGHSLPVIALFECLYPYYTDDCPNLKHIDTLCLDAPALESLVSQSTTKCPWQSESEWPCMYLCFSTKEAGSAIIPQVLLVEPAKLVDIGVWVPNRNAS
jgi:hypothetical protein